MNYSKALKGSLSPVDSINSAAETELGRKLKRDELLLLTEKFSLALVDSSIQKYGYGSVKFLLKICTKSEYNCFMSPNPTPRDGNCLLHAIADGILSNEAFRHTFGGNNLESWSNLLQDFKFFGEMDTQEHRSYMRQRFVTGASDWLAGNHGSKVDDKENLGYTDSEWETIWTSMLEDGAWAMPSLKDDEGNSVKENFAPEMLIKYIAHDLKAHIIVFDLHLDRIQFISGNHLKSSNVIFESPLLLYATGGHFQAVFQKDHAYFIALAKELDGGNSDSQAQSRTPESQNNVKGTKRLNETHRNDSKKRMTDNCNPGVSTEGSKVVHENRENETVVESRLEEIRRIKTKDRSKELQREYNTLMRKRNRDEASKEKVNSEKEKDRLRRSKVREDEEIKAKENVRKAKSREDKELKAKENEKEKARKAKLREDEEMKAKENMREKARKAKLREDKEMKAKENEKEKARKAKVREDKEMKAKENEKEKARKAKVREDEEMKAKENKKEKARKAKLREDEITRNKLNLSLKASRQKLKNKAKEPFKNIAVDKDQNEFRESEIPDEIMSSSIGSIWNEENQCPFCEAYKFKNERNFCCGKGKVNQVPVLPEPPFRLKELFQNESLLKNTRGYNNILAMASVGCNTPDEVRGPNFKIQGKVHHKIGSLIPSEESSPKFLQLYFYDTDEATEHRIDLMPKLSSEILKELTDIVKETNCYVKSFKAAYELVESESEVKIVLISDKNKIPAGEHSRRYNLPQGCEVAALMPGEGDGELEVIVRDNNNKLTRINALHRSYDPLSYVLVDPYGTDGFHTDVGKKVGTTRKVSLAEFYSFRIQVRPGFNLLLKSRRCFQQYLVDQASKIENARMKWVLDNQKTIKAEKYNGLLDASATGDLAKAGVKIILPPTITGSPRFYVEKFQDAMAIARKFGKPTLFITMTCNPEWPEIKDALNPGETAFDRPDITTRVFKLKNDMLLDDIEKKEIFGKVIAFVGTQEQQKRKGLHHTHTLITLESVPRNPEDIDKMVSAEIPDKEINPELYEIIIKNNIHGPCGKLNSESPCMETDDRGRKFCSKEFPKDFQDSTSLTEFTYPKYRRRGPASGGKTAIKKVKGKDIVVDNGLVVPYNSFLSKKYGCHVNVEFCESVVAVKYIYKYITKGPDRCMMSTKSGEGTTNEPVNNVNEVEQFVDARYLGASEAVLKILRFPVHYRSHSVEKLPCHLPGEQSIIFNEGEEEAVLNAGPPETKLTAFFKTNLIDEDAKDLLYTDFPGHFVWKAGEWRRKKRAIGNAIGRIPTVSLCAKQMETYALRILLHHVRGPTCFDDLKTIDGEAMDTFQEACQKLGLLEDDSEVQQALSEACSIRFGDQLISFFGSLLEFCRPGNPLSLWEKFKTELMQHVLHTSDVTNEEAESTVLEKLRDQLNRSGSDLKDFNLPEPTKSISTRIPALIAYETNFDRKELHSRAQQNFAKMNSEQSSFFMTVFESVSEGSGGLFCLNAAGGTGKTFTLNTLLDKVRSEGWVALATASSGVASKLLHNGTTVHSRFKVPIKITSTSTCSFKSSDATGKLIIGAKLIIMDEMTMLHRHVFEAVDKSIRELTGKNEPFGGITTAFSGDWRQCLPIVRRGSRADVLHACLKSSELWKKTKVTNLIQNMRVQLKGESSEFSDLLLNIGDGALAENQTLGEAMIELPHDLFIGSSSASELVNEVFPDFTENSHVINWVRNRAILCPTNEECSEINKILLDKLPGNKSIYKSCDSVNHSEAHMYPTEFLNTIELQGIPPHVLELKQGAVIILLRNLNPSEGHVNGTRYVVQNLLPHVIDAVAISGSNMGSKIFIPRIMLLSQDATLPFEMKRKQFPVKLAYSMTANKAQGQTLESVGIYIAREFFSHGQFYVAISRVGNPDSVKILFKKENRFHVRNIVYREILK